MARHVLIKRYWWALLAGIIALLLCGAGSIPSLHITFELEDWFDSIFSFFRSLRSPHQLLRHLFSFSTGSFLSLLFAIGLLFVGAAIELGYNRYHLRQYETATAPGLDMLFSRFSIFWRAVGLRMLTLLKVFLWSLLFIVPGIVAAFRYALAPYILAEDPEVAPREAMERSRELMLGHKARLFRLYLSFIGWYLLAILTAGAGFLFLEPYVKTAVTGFYLERVGRLPLPGEPPTYHESPKTEPKNEYSAEPRTEDPEPAEAPRPAEEPGEPGKTSHTDPEWI
jgi:hypothetical protein